jgi:hypothetical protein
LIITSSTAIPFSKLYIARKLIDKYIHIITIPTVLIVRTDSLLNKPKIMYETQYKSQTTNQ